MNHKAYYAFFQKNGNLEEFRAIDENIYEKLQQLDWLIENKFRIFTGTSLTGWAVMFVPDKEAKPEV